MNVKILVLSLLVHLASSLETCPSNRHLTRAKRLSAAPPPSICKAPPFTWCENGAIAKLCGAQAACKSYAQNVQGQLVNITLLYESMCPGCAQFITTVLYPMWQRDHSAFNVELVPYGNHQGAECQHGWQECVLNRFEACALDAMKANFSAAFDFVNCFETIIPQMPDLNPDKVLQKCFTKLRTDATIKQAILACNTSDLGDQLTTKMQQKTDNVWPDAHDFVPWVIINGVSLESQQGLLQESLDGAVALAHRG